MVSDSIEEMHIYSVTPFGANTLRFIRVADNNVLLVLEADIVALLTLEEQKRLSHWLMRRVQETS